MSIRIVLADAGARRQVDSNERQHRRVKPVLQKVARIIAQFGLDFGHFFHATLTTSMAGNAIPTATIAEPHLLSLRCKLLVRLS